MLPQSLPKLNIRFESNFGADVLYRGTKDVIKSRGVIPYFPRGHGGLVSRGAGGHRNYN